MARSKVKPLEECAALLEIDVSKETVDKAFDEIYSEIMKVASVPGFRPGKAPKELVRKHYAKHAHEEAMKKLLPEAYAAALQEHRINPIGMPEISDIVFEEGKDMSFKARVEMRPKFTIKNYKGISVKSKKVAVGSSDIDKTLESIREMNAKYSSPEDRPLRMGDYAISNMECEVDGKAVHKKRENLWLYMDKDTIAPGLSEGMVGMNKNDEKSIDIVFPKEHADKSMAGKKAAYRVKVNDIKVRDLPEVNDALAKSMGKDSLEALKKDILTGLEAQAKRNSEIEVENKVLTKIVEDNKFGVPSGIVKRQLEQMVENAKRRLLEKGFKKDDLDKKDDEFRAKFKDDAEKRVRLLFILDAVAAAEKIEVTDGDMAEAYKVISEQTGKSEDEIKAHYEREDITADLKEQLKEGKAIEFLVKNARVTEEQ